MKFANNIQQILILKQIIIHSITIIKSYHSDHQNHYPIPIIIWEHVDVSVYIDLRFIYIIWNFLGE